MKIDKLEIVYNKDKFWWKVKAFIVKHFFPIRCHACSCVDCQLGDLGREYWYCHHLNANICSICCVYDSLDPNWDWKECAFCSHDQDREHGPDLNKLWEPKEA